MVVRDAVCLVTGGSSGIGRATALALARADARVVVTGRNADRVEDAARTCGGTGIVADLGEPEDIRRLVAAVGPVDVLVNNAGLGWSGPFAEMPEGAIEALARVNLVGPALLARAVLPGMLERGRGHVVNIASVVGHVGVKDEALYAATKAGIVALTESLQQELARSPVGVTLVSPGVVDTPLFEHRGRPYGRQRPKPIPAERMAAAIVRGIETRAPLVVAPRWLEIPMRLHGVAPRLYCRLASRWG